MPFRHAAGSQKLPVFRPQCTHLTMTRLYGLEFLCESCQRPGPFGWVYRCTQDREELIEHAVSRGNDPVFDKLGQEFVDELKVRKRSPAAREDRLSFFSEITPEQMSNYQPNQIALILQQREDLQVSIQRERLRQNGAAMLSRFRQAAGVGGDNFPLEYEYRKPWVCDNDQECQYKVCPFCRPGAADRSFLSLNAVADNDLSPTAVTGFGFHTLGERPVVDVGILRTFGKRPPPQSRSKRSSSNYSSDLSMIEMLDDQIARLRRMGMEKEMPDDTATKTLLPAAEIVGGCLPHSPKYDDLAAFNQHNRYVPQGASVRPPWTPPPSPSSRGEEEMTKSHVLGLAAEPSFTNGRSSESLKTNPRVRNELFASVPSSSGLDYIRQSCHVDSNARLPYLPESAYDVGLTLPFNEDEYETAQRTPLAPPDAAEDTYLHEAITSMMEHEEDAGKFTPAPLRVDHGIAVLEESIEMRVPDVITQT